MRAVAYREILPIDDPNYLVDMDLPNPVPAGCDLLVDIRAVSVNPVDIKTRQRPKSSPDSWGVLGYDAAGIVTATGPDCTLFKVGDHVFYAGTMGRPGSNSERHLVDERIVGRKPDTLSWEEAAAMPLTSITAWEGLFDQLDVRRPVQGAAPAILVIGAAGGVGSMVIQLARALSELQVVATASRQQTREWALAMGAHELVDHSRPLRPQIEALGLGAPAFVFSTTTEGHVREIAEIIAPRGRFVLIDDPADLDVIAFKPKSVSIHWEFMDTPSRFKTPDIGKQGEILNEIARLVDMRKLRTTITKCLGPINASNLQRAHRLVGSGRMVGKVVLTGFA